MRLTRNSGTVTVPEKSQSPLTKAKEMNRIELRLLLETGASLRPRASKDTVKRHGSFLIASEGHVRTRKGDVWASNLT